MRFFRVEGEVEGRALADRALGPHLTAMALHDLAEAGEADAGAGELAGRVQPLERGEQLVDEGRVKTGAVVAHVIAHGGVSGRHRRELNQRVLAAGDRKSVV